ncbi:MAG: DNA-directed RNA polymerase subunit beta, partial [Microgenomates group bacterium Gr01-1014_93]
MHTQYAFFCCLWGHLLMSDKPSGDVTRKYWGTVNALRPNLDLIQLQKDSYNSFLSEGIQEVLDEISPVEDFTGKNWTLGFNSYSFGKPKYTAEKAQEKGVSFEAPLRVETVLTEKQTGKKFEQEVFLGDIPQMTDKGSFIINGVE